LNTKKFSLPFNSFITKKEYQEWYYPFLKEYKEYIYDIYFSVIISPFTSDAMGYSLNTEHCLLRDTLDLMLHTQKELHITVSPTFNNINIPPTLENREKFIKSLQFLYEKGIRSVTIPHIHWMLDGKIKRLFPDMIVKNTVLRKVNSSTMYVDYVNAGFDVINIDRINLRNKDNLKRFKKAYDKFQKPIAILVNEGCKGGCPAMDEHHTLNSTTNIGYFEHPLTQHSCPTWRTNDKAYHLKRASMPIFREDFQEIEEFVQIFKIFGRNHIELLKDGIQIIKDYADGKDIIGRDWLGQYDYDEKKLDAWREYIKNCQFECWDCKVCDDLATTSKDMVMGF
jgi:hypothetical protein